MISPTMMMETEPGSDSDVTEADETNESINIYDEVLNHDNLSLYSAGNSINSNEVFDYKVFEKATNHFA